MEQFRPGEESVCECTSVAANKRRREKALKHWNNNRSTVGMINLTALAMGQV